MATVFSSSTLHAKQTYWRFTTASVESDFDFQLIIPIFVGGLVVFYACYVGSRIWCRRRVAQLASQNVIEAQLIHTSSEVIPVAIADSSIMVRRVEAEQKLRMAASPVEAT